MRMSLYLCLCKYKSVPACLRNYALKHNLSPKQNTWLYWKSIKPVCVSISTLHLKQVLTNELTECEISIIFQVHPPSQPHTGNKQVQLAHLRLLSSPSHQGGQSYLLNWFIRIPCTLTLPHLNKETIFCFAVSISQKQLKCVGFCVLLIFLSMLMQDMCVLS